MAVVFRRMHRRVIWVAFFWASMVLMGLVPRAASAQNEKGEGGGASKTSAEALRIYEGAANAQINKAYDVAAEEWARFLAKFPDDPLARKARYYEGICHRKLKNWERAIESLEMVVQDQPKFELLEDAYLNLGWCQHAAADAGKKELYEKAAATFAILLDKFPEGKHRSEALFFRGESLYAIDKKQDAVAAYRELVEKDAASPLRCNALYSMGVTLEGLKDFPAAGEAYDLFLKDCRENKLAGEVRMRKAETLLQTGDVERAERMFAAVAAEPGFFAADHALLRRAFCLARLSRFEGAATVYVKLATDFPQSGKLADAQVGAGRSYFRAKQYDRATTWLTRALANGGEGATEAAHWLCQIQLAQKQPAEAERIANQYLKDSKEHPSHVDLMVDLANAYFEQPEKRAQSIDAYLQIAEQFRDHRLAPQSLYNAAFTALELKQYDQSQKLVAQFLTNYKDNALVPDARFVAVEAALQKRDFATVKGDLQTLIDEYPQRFDRNIWRVRYGRALYLNAEYDAAIQHLDAIVKDLGTPELLAEAQYLIGVSHFTQNRFEEAAARCEASLLSSKEWRQADEAMLTLARCRQRQNQLDAAKTTLHELIAKFPQSAVLDQAQYRLGEAHYAAAEFQPALESYQQVAKINAKSIYLPFALYGSGWSQMKLGQHPAAIEAFTELIKDFPEHELADDALLASGMARRQAGQLEPALDDLNKYLETKPQEPQKSDAMYERALVEVALKRYSDAAQTLTGLAESNPAYASMDKVQYELAWTYRSANEKDKSLAEFSRLAAEFPQSPLAAEANFHLAENFYDQQQYAEAIQSYTAAHAKATGELKEKAAYKLGWAHFQLKDYDRAVGVFSEEQSSFPEGALHADAVFMLAESLFQQQKYEEALTAFTDALGVKPSSEKMQTLTLLHGGQSAARLEDWERAFGLLEAIPEKFPKSPYLAEALYECGWVQQNLSHFEEALGYYDKAAAQRDVIGARARFMMGQVRSTQKNYDEAIREFQRVMYLYGADDAPPEIKSWQAKAAYEAGHCAELQVEKAANADARTNAIANAKKFYSFVTQKHSDNELAAEAQKRLEVLATL